MLRPGQYLPHEYDRKMRGVTPFSQKASRNALVDDNQVEANGRAKCFLVSAQHLRNYVQSYLHESIPSMPCSFHLYMSRKANSPHKSALVRAGEAAPFRRQNSQWILPVFVPLSSIPAHSAALWNKSGCSANIFLSFHPITLSKSALQQA